MADEKQAAGVMLTRRAALVGATGLIGATAFSRGLLAQDATRVTVTSYGGIFEKVMREKVIPRFEKETPYKVNLVVTDEPDIVSKLVIGRGRPAFDAITVNHETAIMLGEAGLLMDDQQAKFKNAADIYPNMMPPKAAVYGTTIYKFDFVYRTASFPTAPTSWQDLWKPGLSIGVPSVTQPYGITFLYLAALLNGGSAGNLDPGFKAIKRLSKFKIYNTASQGMQLFQQNEVDAAFYYSHRAQQMKDLGLPVERTEPTEGVYAQITGTQIPKGAANLPGALAWADFTLSEGYQGALADQLYSPTNKRVPLPKEKTASFITGDAAVSELLSPPWAELMPQRDAILDQWRKEIG